MRYILFVIHDGSYTAAPNEMAAIDAFNEKIEAAGQRVMAAGIGFPASATLIDNRNNVGDIQKRTLFDSPDFYNGFWIIDVESAEQAEQLALESSLACNRRVELRPFL